MLKSRLSDIRKKRGYTQQNMADYLNIALRSYQRYESGSHEPTLQVLVIIADYLDVSIDYLLGRDDFMKAHGVFFDE